MEKQIAFRIDEETFIKFKQKLKKESKNMTLFFQNLVEEYLKKEIKKS